MSDDPIGLASEQYDEAEQAYIHAIESGADDTVLRGLARKVAVSARAWESVDNSESAPPSGLTRYYDVPDHGPAPTPSAAPLRAWMDEGNAPLAEIANQLGHGDINVTATYLGRRIGPSRAAELL